MTGGEFYSLMRVNHPDIVEEAELDAMLTDTVMFSRAAKHVGFPRGDGALSMDELFDQLYYWI